MPTKRVNIAVVGLGFMGVTHLRAYRQLPNARLIAVCDTSRRPVNGVLPGVKGNLGSSASIPLGRSVRFYKEFDALLANEEVELVDICTPTALHPSQVAAAMSANKHVLCEKPLARSAEEARKLLKSVNSSRKFLMPAMCMRFWPGWAEMKNIVENRTYGRVLAASFRRHSARPAWSKSGVHCGGALYDLHIHDTDFVYFLFGKPQKVFSSGLVDGEGNVDHVVTQYLYPGGPAVQAEGSWLLARGFNMAFTLLCEQATIDFNLSRGARAMQITGDHKAQRIPSGVDTDGYHAELRYFVNRVARGEKPSVVTAQDSVTLLEILHAEERSVRSGKPVAL